MFGLVSKKKYRELEEKYWKGIKDYESLAVKYADMERKLNSQDTGEMVKSIDSAFWQGIANTNWKMLCAARKERDELQAELQKYKQKYADELQKRLELAERVKELERHFCRSAMHKEGDS